MRTAISSPYARIGRRGGRASTPAKAMAARRDVQTCCGTGMSHAGVHGQAPDSRGPFAHRAEFGPCLAVFFIGRQDQVALKLYASIGREIGQRHLEDLEAIEPARSGIEFAVHWLLDRPTSTQFRQAVRSVARALGFVKLKAFKEVGPAANVPARQRTKYGRLISASAEFSV